MRILLIPLILGGLVGPAGCGSSGKAVPGQAREEQRREFDQAQKRVQDEELQHSRQQARAH